MFEEVTFKLQINKKIFEALKSYQIKNIRLSKNPKIKAN